MTIYRLLPRQMRQYPALSSGETAEGRWMSRMYRVAHRVPRSQKTTTACMCIFHPVDLVHNPMTSQDTRGM